MRQRVEREKTIPKRRPDADARPEHTPVVQALAAHGHHDLRHYLIAPSSDAARSTPSPNRTGIPDRLKTGIEALSGISLDNVRVHRNSARPARLQAHAYAQGADIHLGPGQERHLAHEAWHVVQQKQGRVGATGRLNGSMAVNDDPGLEREADLMGKKAAGFSGGLTVAAAPRPDAAVQANAVQRFKMVGDYLVSENERFALDGQSASVVLGTDVDAPPRFSKYADRSPVEIVLDADAKPKRKRTYFSFRPESKVLEDCIAAVEHIVTGQASEDGGADAIEFASDREDRAWSVNNAKGQPVVNKKAAAATNAGHDADPGIGQGYALVHQSGKNKAGAPYHGSTVVAQDGSDDLTLEVYRAAGWDEKPAQVDPKYYMYKRGDKAESFLGYWTQVFAGKNSVSVVRAIPKE